ncbi:thiol-disulfide oxidoreductase DCC family protein [Ferrimonas balearica]|uniref:thiol-disulfide oxidoreductase DCC family protein n=1 Tax=Ferrimonas balearica TaxID=44012 RepID=UPI001C9A17DC|nr:thiol-disulfide oxidoreductase DCC family protein [Ferrimonas balearica]MBY5992338.1 thiol-disulfide oxidoreductase DCC family protein [Ferrimonas balearica]
MRPDNGIILFDGVCNFCNATVRFVWARDPKGYFRFAPLQSATAETLLAAHPLPRNGDTVVLIQNGRAYQKSAAALRIARQLSGLWPLMACFLLVPRPLRDAVYDFIGRRRYRWFGRSEQCQLPSAELRRRFLDTA